MTRTPRTLSFTAASAASLLPDLEMRNPEVGNTRDPVDSTDSSNTSTGIAVITETPGASDSSGHYMTDMGKTLYIGGAVALGASIAYGGYQHAECGSFSSYNDGKQRGGLDAVANVLGVAGAVSLSVATYLYFSTSDAERSSPIAMHVSSQSVGLSLGGQF